MATVPSFRTWVTGEVATAAEFNSNVRDAGNFLVARPLLSVYQTVAQALTSGNWAPILMDSEASPFGIDRDNAHSTTTNTSRYTPQTPGWYLITGVVAFTNPGTGAGVRGCGLTMNGNYSNIYFRHEVPAVSSFPTCLPTHGWLYCNGTTDYVELVGVHTQGTSLNTETVTGARSSLSAVWMSS